jgi:uncharacterized protein (TIGR00369 family)
MNDTASRPGSDVAPDNIRKTISGLAFLQGIIAGRYPPAPMATALDFALTEVEHGRAVFVGTPSRRFYNPIGTVHGGYAATLLDSCTGCAVHTTLAPGQGYTTLEIKVNLVRPITTATGPVRAEGRVIHAGARVATADGRLTDDRGKLLAHGMATCLIMPL